MEPREIRQKIRDTLKARGPLLRREIVAEFQDDGVDPAEVEATINRLVSLQVLYPAPRHRVADFDYKVCLREQARRLISTSPQSRKDLAARLAQLGTCAAQTFLEKDLFDELREASDIFLHFGPNNQLLLSTQIPSPEETLRPVLPRIQALLKARIDRATIQRVLFGESPDLAPSNVASPSNERDRDFQRDACELLVYAWQDAEGIEIRRALEPIMQNLGLQPIEESGGVVEFNGLFHQSSRDVSKGQAVRVLLPGWQLRDEHGGYLITRARVEPVS